jgi:hypothetical protein
VTALGFCSLVADVAAQLAPNAELADLNACPHSHNHLWLEQIFGDLRPRVCVAGGRSSGVAGIPPPEGLHLKTASTSRWASRSRLAPKRSARWSDASVRLAPSS